MPWRSIDLRVIGTAREHGGSGFRQVNFFGSAQSTHGCWKITRRHEDLELELMLIGFRCQYSEPFRITVSKPPPVIMCIEGFLSIVQSEQWPSCYNSTYTKQISLTVLQLLRRRYSSPSLFPSSSSRRLGNISNVHTAAILHVRTQP